MGKNVDRKLRLGIVGSRDFDNYDKVKNAIAFVLASPLNERFTGLQIISGGANGADALGERFAAESEGGVSCSIFHANWDEFGKVAGFKRNTTIVNNSDIVLAFWDGKSRGTKDTIDKTVKANKPVFIFPAGKPRKLQET
jgi:hypothetical protein